MKSVHWSTDYSLHMTMYIYENIRLVSYLILDFLCDCQDMQIAKKPFAVRVKVKLQNLHTQYDKKCQILILVWWVHY